MSARLTSTSVVFGDNSTLSSYYGIIPKNTVTFLYQSFTPFGWTNLSSQNDKTLRVVSGDGGGQGGSLNFSNFNNSVTGSNPTTISGILGQTTLSLNTIPNHKHPSPDGTTVQGGGSFRGGQGYQINSANFSSGSGIELGLRGNSHGHPFQSRSGTVSYNINFQVNYVDVILVRFN
jgi:hypothetical protein